MSRKRSCSFSETKLSSQTALMDLPGSASKSDDDFMKLEPDEELLCSVSDIVEHVGRNITMVVETALTDIRKVVSIKIRVLKLELCRKNEEIETLKARLEMVERDGGACTSSQEASTKSSFMKLNSISKNSTDIKRGKSVVPGIKKEKIDAICDYLMKDKNSKGRVDVEEELISPLSDEKEVQAEPEHPLSLWSDSGMAGSGSVNEISDPSAHDIFSIFSSSSKRMYEYEWPMGYSLDPKAMKSADCENTESVKLEDDDNRDELSGNEGGELQQTQASLSRAQPCEFSEGQSSLGEEGNSLDGNMDKLDPAHQFSRHTYICSLCGTFCPDSVFLEEHIKLLHSDDDQMQMLKTRPFTSSVVPPADEGSGSIQALRDGSPGIGSNVVTVKRRSAKVEGRYECGDCGRHFNYLGNLRQHQRIHTGEKPFVCPECGERFRHAARLKSHRLIHSDAQSPFPCPQCGKGFSVLSGLKRHQRVHTGESPYVCSECGRRFKELGNLYTHQRIHSGVTPYCCQQCGQSFRHLGTFKSHRCVPAQ